MLPRPRLLVRLLIERLGVIKVRIGGRPAMPSFAIQYPHGKGANIGVDHVVVVRTRWQINCPRMTVTEILYGHTKNGVLWTTGLGSCW